MKNLILITVLAFILLTSCNQKSKNESMTESEMMQNDSTMMSRDGKMMESDSMIMQNDGPKIMSTEKMYACQMHPEVQGKLNDKCAKCGMKLTEPVAENTVE